MKKKLSYGLVFPALVALVASGTPAAAQMINYGGLQDIFEEPVTTSATGTPQRASEIAADMMIINADQIRQSGSRSVPEILNMYVPGLNVLQEGINEYDVGIRGFQQPYNPRLLVLIDGRQVFSYDYSRTQWDNLPLNIDDVRQIEVVRGTSSALFGSNATSGVVNIITYSPLYDTHNVANVTFGTQHAYQGDATLMHRFGNSGGVKMSAGGLTEREYSATAQGAADYHGSTEPFHEYVDGSGYFKASPSFTVGGEVSASTKKGPEVLPDDFVNSNDTTTYSARAGWQWNSPFGTIKNDNYVNQNLLSYAMHYPDAPEGYPDQDTFTNNSLIVSRLEDLFDVGSKHTFRVYGEYRHKYSIFSTNNFNTYEEPILNEDVYTLGGTWLWHIRDDLSWTNALRYDINHTSSMAGVLNNTVLFGTSQPYTADDFNRQYATVSANSGLVYTVTNKDTVRATYGRGIIDPSLINTGIFTNGYLSPNVMGLPFIYQMNGAPDTKPTIVTDYNLGYDRKVPEIFSTAHAGVFYETNRDLIGATSTDMGMVFTNHGPALAMIQGQGNVGKAHGIGGEIALDGSTPTGYRWNVSYSYTQVHDSSGVAAVSNFTRSAPQNQVRLNLGRTIGKWELDAHGLYASSTDMLRTTDPNAGPAPYFVDSYYTLGGRVGYRILDGVTVALSGSNLTSMRTVESPYTILQRRIFLGATAEF